MKMTQQMAHSIKFWLLFTRHLFPIVNVYTRLQVCVRSVYNLYI